jgi:phage gp45-like
VGIREEGGEWQMNLGNVLDPILSRLRLIVGRCTVIASKYVSGELETDVELIAGEKRRGVEFVQQYGFSSRPKGEVDGIALFIGGSRENGVVVATHSDFPEKLEEGEVAVHSPYGQYIWLKKDGSIVAKPTNGKSFLIEGALDVRGHVFATDEVAAKCVDAAGTFVNAAAYNLSTHKHGSAMGPTTPSIPGP